VTGDAAQERLRGVAGQGLRYLLAGGVITLFYLSVYGVLLWSGVHYFVAILLAQSVTIVIAFPVYRRFVFGPGDSVVGDFVRFLSVWVGGPSPDSSARRSWWSCSAGIPSSVRWSPSSSSRSRTSCCTGCGRSLRVGDEEMEGSLRASLRLPGCA